MGSCLSLQRFKWSPFPIDWTRFTLQEMKGGAAISLLTWTNRDHVSGNVSWSLVWSDMESLWWHHHELLALDWIWFTLKDPAGFWLVPSWPFLTGLWWSLFHPCWPSWVLLVTLVSDGPCCSDSCCRPFRPTRCEQEVSLNSHSAHKSWLVPSNSLKETEVKTSSL